MNYDFDRLSFPVLICGSDAVIRYHNRAASPFRCFRRGLSLASRLSGDGPGTPAALSEQTGSQSVPHGTVILQLRQDIPFRTAFIVLPGGEPDREPAGKEDDLLPFPDGSSVWFFFPALQVGAGNGITDYTDDGIDFCLLRAGEVSLAICRRDRQNPFLSSARTGSDLPVFAAVLRDSLSHLLRSEKLTPENAPPHSFDFSDGIGVLRRFVRLSEPDSSLSLAIEDEVDPALSKTNTLLLFPDFALTAALLPALLSFLSDISDSRCALLSLRLEENTFHISLATDCLSENGREQPERIREVIRQLTAVLSDPADNSKESDVTLDASFSPPGRDGPGYRRLKISLSVHLLPGHPIPLGVRVLHSLPIGAFKLIFAMLLFSEIRGEKIHNGVTQWSQFQGTI